MRIDWLLFCLLGLLSIVFPYGPTRKAGPTFVRVCYSLLVCLLDCLSVSLFVRGRALTLLELPSPLVYVFLLSLLDVLLVCLLHGSSRRSFLTMCEWT